jgi:hypothetical protein
MKREQENAERRARDTRAGRTLTPDMDRLSASLPDPKRLSLVCRSALARKSSRLLAFARTLRHRHVSLPGANPLAFLESLFKGKFTTTEGGAFSGSKVYRKATGDIFVSETTRLSISVRQRFDLHALTVKLVRAGSPQTKEIVTQRKEVLTTRTLRLLSTNWVKENAPPSVRWLNTNFDSRSYQTISQGFVSVLERRTHPGSHQTMSLPHASTLPEAIRESMTVQMWKAFSASTDKLLSAFNYTNAREPHVKEAHKTASTLYIVHGGGATTASTETRRLSQVGARVSYQPTCLDLRPQRLCAPRQEFLRVRFNTSTSLMSVGAGLAPARAFLQRPWAGTSPAPTVLQRALSAHETQTHLTPARRTQVQQLPGQIYAGLTPRQASRGAVEIWKKDSTTTPMSERGLGLGQLQMLSHKTGLQADHALLKLFLGQLSLVSHKTVVTAKTGGAVGIGSARGSAQLNERVPTLPLQYSRMHRALSGSQEAPSAVYTFGGRVHTFRVDPQRQTDTPHAVNSTLFVRPLAIRQLQSVGLPSEARVQILRGSTPVVGASTFLFSSRLLEPSASTATRAGSAQKSVLHDRLAQDLVLRRSLLSAMVSDRGVVVSGQSVVVSDHAAARGMFAFPGQATAHAGSSLSVPFVSSRFAFAWGQPPASTTTRAATFERATQETRETRATRPEGIALELIRQRRDEVLRLPPLGYVFTQPARPTVEEQRVITKTSEREIVEVVKREVRTLMSSNATPQGFSRADFAGLADEVYSTLVRRLLVEKERLGLSA